MELANKTINFLGDSITEGVGTSAEENIYLNIIKEKYGLKAVNNYGISGTRYAKQKIPSDNPRWDENFPSRVDKMDKNADIVVVFGGVNDFAHGDARIGNISDRTESTFYGACHVLYRKLIETFLGKPIIIVTPLHCEYEDCLRGEGHKTSDYYPLSEYVKTIKEVAGIYALPVCDLNAISGIQPKIPKIKEAFVPDGIHPNDEGHKIIAERLGSFLRNL